MGIKWCIIRRNRQVVFLILEKSLSLVHNIHIIFTDRIFILSIYHFIRHINMCVFGLESGSKSCAK